MSFWIISAFVLLATLIAIVRPILRARSNSSNEYNTIVYYDQLNEIEHDIKRGLLSFPDGEALKAEIEKRIEENKSLLLAIEKIANIKCFEKKK